MKIFITISFCILQCAVLLALSGQSVAAENPVGKIIGVTGTIEYLPAGSEPARGGRGPGKALLRHLPEQLHRPSGQNPRDLPHGPPAQLTTARHHPNQRQAPQTGSLPRCDYHRHYHSDYHGDYHLITIHYQTLPFREKDPW